MRSVPFVVLLAILSGCSNSDDYAYAEYEYWKNAIDILVEEQVSLDESVRWLSALQVENEYHNDDKRLFVMYEWFGFAEWAGCQVTMLRGNLYFDELDKLIKHEIEMESTCG